MSGTILKSLILPGTTANAIVLGTIDSSKYFQGYLDEVKFYDYQRTAAQVKTDAIRSAAPAGAGVAIGAQIHRPAK